MIEKVDDIRDEIEGQQLRVILEQEGIPHHIRSYHDSAYDGLFQVQLGWGYVEAPSPHKARIRAILQELRSGRTPLPDRGGPSRN
jgi:hypothetical protein